MNSIAGITLLHELVSSQTLKKLMYVNGGLPSSQENSERIQGLILISRIGSMWSPDMVLVPYGSYLLGVHTQDSDMDVLCLFPLATQLEEFFTVFGEKLGMAPGVSEFQAIRTAKVPLLKVMLANISYDIVPTQVEPSVLENLMMNRFSYCTAPNCDPALLPVTHTYKLLQSVEHAENFEDLTRCIKCWAIKKGIYGTHLGKLGGVHIATLSTYICKKFPIDSLASKMQLFFWTFAQWDWSNEPVIVDADLVSRKEIREGHSPLMRIQLLGSGSNLWCTLKMTESTFARIVREFNNGYKTAYETGRWEELFDPFDGAAFYSHFLKIRLSADNDVELQNWVGIVQSHFGTLLNRLERHNIYCDPNGRKYNEAGAPNVVFYWGLMEDFGVGTGLVNAGDLPKVVEKIRQILRKHTQGRASGFELSFFSKQIILRV